MNAIYNTRAFKLLIHRQGILSCIVMFYRFINLFFNFINYMKIILQQYVLYIRYVMHKILYRYLCVMMFKGTFTTKGERVGMKIGNYNIAGIF